MIKKKVDKGKEGRQSEGHVAICVMRESPLFLVMESSLLSSASTIVCLASVLASSLTISSYSLDYSFIEARLAK